MARVSDWFDEWAVTLRDRSGRQDWPDATSESGLAFWDDFERALVRIGATFDLADEASSAACDVPNLYPNQFRSFVVEAIRKLQSRSQAESRGGDLRDPEAARIASRDCWDCGGSGFAPRYVHPEILGKVRTVGGHEAPVGMRVGYPCSCPLGKLAASGLRQDGQARDPLTVDDYPSLRLRPVPWPSDHPAGLDCRFRHHPDRWDAFEGRPMAPEIVVASRDEGLEMLRSLTESSRMPQERPARRGWPDRPSGRREAQEGASAAPGSRPDIDAPIPDPVLQKERGEPAPAKPLEELYVPEDDLNWL